MSGLLHQQKLRQCCGLHSAMNSNPSYKLCLLQTLGALPSQALGPTTYTLSTPLRLSCLQARLRVTCLAAALGLNTSLTEVELAGWTWSEGAYVGIAAPFLALGSNQSSTLAGSGGVGANGLVAALGSSGMSKAGTPVPGMRATGSGRVSMSGSPSTQMAVPTLPALSSQLTHVQVGTVGALIRFEKSFICS
jgi:hypothetical protein